MNNFFDFTNLKVVADNILNVVKMIEFVFDMVENSVGKGEITGNKVFSTFLRMFSKFLFPRDDKPWDCLVKH